MKQKLCALGKTGLQIDIFRSQIYGPNSCISSYLEMLGTPLQYSCLENPMDRGAWWAAVHGVAKSRTRLSDFTFTFHFHALEKDMATHSIVLAWRIPGTGSLVGCRLWGRTDSDTTEVTQQQHQHHFLLFKNSAISLQSCNFLGGQTSLMWVTVSIGGQFLMIT